MKKNLFLFSVAALALGACSNDLTVEQADQTVNQPKEIAFFPLAQSTTRATSNTNYGYINGTTFATGWDMTVSAYDITNSRQFFTGTDFTYATTPAYWHGGKYWPLSATQINFLAIAHANADNATGVTWTTNNTPTHQVEVVMSDNYAYNSAQRDFIYAIGHGAVNQVGNALTFPEKVDMEFKHTQAYLVFNLKAADATSTAITITNVKVKGARTSGTATIARTNASTYGDAATSLYWNPTGYHTNASTLESVTSTQAAISTALTTSPVEMGHLLVVPNMSDANTFDEGGFTSFEISYTLDGNAYTYEYTPVSTKLEAGKKYIYDITFNLHEIFVNPSVEDWDAEDTRYVDVPVVSMAYNELTAVTLDNAAGVYSFVVSGFTAGYDVSVAETTDASNIITAVNAPSTVPTGGAVLVEITKPATSNGQTATITLTVNSVDYVITIKTPVTP